MHSHIPQDNVFISISVTVAAKMAAGVVGSDVPCEIAGAFFSVVRI